VSPFPPSREPLCEIKNSQRIRASADQLPEFRGVIHQEMLLEIPAIPADFPARANPAEPFRWVSKPTGDYWGEATIPKVILQKLERHIPGKQS